MQLHKDYADKGVDCVSVSWDKANHITADKALEFLKKKDATFANYYAEDGESFADKWDFDGALPMIRVFDRDGKKKGDYRSYSEVIPVVKELLATAE